MAQHTEIFEGCTIVINDTKLTINGKEIDYQYDAAKDKFSSKYMPYTLYGSLLELARAIAKNSVEFSHVQE